MSGIKYYPSRDQSKYQKIAELDSNSNSISVTLSDIDKLYLCNNSTPASITLSAPDNDRIPVGSKIDFIRMSNNVTFSASANTITYRSAAGTTPQLRTTNSACTFVKISSNSWAILGDIIQS